MSFPLFALSTVRRYYVDGEVPPGFRDSYAEALRRMAFREPPVPEAEVVGWTQATSILDVGFRDWNAWLLDRYLVVSMRIDVRAIPGKLLQGRIQQAEADWCAERARTRCPAAIRADLREDITRELLRATSPKPTATTVVWSIPDGWVLLGSQAHRQDLAFRKLFQGTFGLRALPVGPLEMLPSELADAWGKTSPASFHP